MTTQSVVHKQIEGKLVPWLQEVNYSSGLLLNNLNIKLQGRISSCLAVDRNIISKIIFRFPENSNLELYNTWLERHLKLQAIYLKLKLKMHAIAWFLCCSEPCYPHWSFIQENIKILTDLKPHYIWTFLKHSLTQNANNVSR